MKQPGHVTAAHSDPVEPGQGRSNPVKPNQTESNRIKPNQTKSNQIKPNQTCWEVGVSRNWTIRCEKESAEGSLVKPSQTQGSQESEQIGSGPFCGLLVQN
jgi:hypothetical protein